MAARINKVNHEEKTKDLIRASQLLNRLTQFANSEIELSPAQVQAIKIIVGKAIPDLKAVEHSGDPDQPIMIRMGWMKAE